MKNLFIDANILLSFYHFSSDDISQLSNLKDLILETSDVKLYVNDQLVDEVNRNRDNKIKDALNKATKNVSLTIPNLYQQHDPRREVKKLTKQLNEKLKEIDEITQQAIIEEELPADSLIKQLMSNPTILTATQTKAAKSRSERRNPPGKPGSIGDALHWEFLLSDVLDGESVCIVSNDTDFVSSLSDEKPNSFLAKEWLQKKGSNLCFHKNLNHYFKAHFPNLVLNDEYKKDSLIESLRISPSFTETRRILYKLITYGDYSTEQMRKLVDASITNNQVYWAHQYSPTSVGERLWQIVDGRESDIESSVMQKFIDYFPRFQDVTEDDENPTDDIQDLPF